MITRRARKGPSLFLQPPVKRGTYACVRAGALYSEDGAGPCRSRAPNGGTVMRRFVPTLGALAACTTALAGAPASVLTFDVVDNGGGSDGFVNLAGTTTIDVYFNNISGASIDGIVGFDFGAAGPGQTRGLAV